MFPKLVMVAASILMFLAAGIFLLIPFITKSAFGVMAVAGVVDPVSFAEDLPVLASQIFMDCLVLSQILIVLAAFSVLQRGAGVVPRRCSILAYGAGGCLLLFAILISAIRLGPVRVLSELVGLGSQADPVELAGELSNAINLMFAAGPLLAAAAMLTVLAVVMPSKATA